MIKLEKNENDNKKMIIKNDNENNNEKEYIQEKRDFKNFFYDKEFKNLILGLILGILICCICCTIYIIYDIILLFK